MWTSTSGTTTSLLGSVRPQLPGDTRWGSQLAACETFLKNRTHYLQIVQDHGDDVDRSVAQKIMDMNLFRQVRDLASQLQPISEAIPPPPLEVPKSRRLGPTPLEEFRPRTPPPLDKSVGPPLKCSPAEGTQMAITVCQSGRPSNSIDVKSRARSRNRFEKKRGKK